MLAGSIFFEIKYKNSLDAIVLGRFIVLPWLEDIDDRRAVNLLLEDMLELPQETLPPEWADTVPMPLIGGLRSDIEQRRKSITQLEKEIEERLKEIADLEVFKKLLYVGGHELESLFAKCLEMCGATISEARYSDEEFVLEYKGEIYLIECKGVAKSIARAHVVQLLGYLSKFEENEGRSGKGILFGNGWKDLPPSERNLKDSVIFPDNVVKSATSNDIALVSSVGFFQLFCRFLAGEVTGDAILDHITSAVGVVTFPGL